MQRSSSHHTYLTAPLQFYFSENSTFKAVISYQAHRYCPETSPKQHCFTDYSNTVFASSKLSMLVTNWLLASVGENMQLFIGLCILGSFVLELNIPHFIFPQEAPDVLTKTLLFYHANKSAVGYKSNT